MRAYTLSEVDIHYSEDERMCLILRGWDKMPLVVVLDDCVTMRHRDITHDSALYLAGKAPDFWNYIINLHVIAKLLYKLALNIEQYGGMIEDDIYSGN